MKSHLLRRQGGRLRKLETEISTYPDGWYRAQGKAPSKARIYAFLMPSLGRRLSIAAFSQAQAEESVCRLWRIDPRRLALLYSYPLRIEQEGS